MLRLIGFLLTLSVAVVGITLVDFKSWRDNAIREERVGLEFEDYLNALPARFAAAAKRSARTRDGLPTDLAEMLPLAPDGWTVRPATPEDAAPFLPANADSLSRADRLPVDSVFTPGWPDGPKTVVLLYERGERRVAVRAVRYPDSDFTSGATQQLLDLQRLAANLDAVPFMTVRGLDLAERPLLAGTRGRLFAGAVGGQIHLQVLASEQMGDDDLVSFLETLNVRAMNASVVLQEDGLGDLPVIALAPAMEEPLREAFVADRSAKAARRVAEAEAAFAAATP